MSHLTRIRSALWMIPIAVAAILYLPSPYLGALMAMLLLAGLYEWANLAHVAGKTHKLLYLLFNAMIITLIAWYDDADHTALKLTTLAGGVFWLFSGLWLWRFNFARENNRQNNAVKLLAGTLACIPAWTALVWLHGEPQGPAWTLAAIGLIAAADSGAYLFGVNFGRHKLAPNISPGKSWEGFWGGLACTTLLAVACMYFFDGANHSIPAFALLGAVTGVFSVAGDLFESLMKRHAQIKDSSSLIPGHGGLLDRLDSIVSGVVMFALLKFWLGL